MTTQTKTIVWRQEGATRTDEEERLEGELLSCSLDSRVKEHPGGAFQCPAAKAPLRESARRYIRRRRSVSGMWRRRVCGEVLDTTISRVSRVPRVSVDRRGFHIFPRRVGPGTWYPYHPPSLVVLELALHQKLRSMESGTRCTNTCS